MLNSAFFTDTNATGELVVAGTQTTTGHRTASRVKRYCNRSLKPTPTTPGLTTTAFTTGMARMPPS